MDQCDERRVWLYQSCGEAPEAVRLLVGVEAEAEADEGRWRGQAACGADLDCPIWCCDIDPNELHASAPLACPTCKALSGWPELAWRTATLRCVGCKGEAEYSLLCPSEEWPDLVPCPNCPSELEVPRLGALLIH